MELDFEERTWFFMDVNNQSATAVGATTGKLITHVPKEEICMGPHFPLRPTNLGNQSELSNVSESNLRVAGAMSFGEISTAS